MRRHQIRKKLVAEMLAVLAGFLRWQFIERLIYGDESSWPCAVMGGTLTLPRSPSAIVVRISTGTGLRWRCTYVVAAFIPPPYNC